MDKILSYPLGFLEACIFIWIMDKILSYPLGFLEALPGRITLGPSAQWLGKPITVAPFSVVGRPYGQNFAGSNIFKTAPISQNKTAPFSKNAVISKITFLIN